MWCNCGRVFNKGVLACAVFHKYESEAEAAHSRKHERWTEANNLVNQMGETETTKFSSMQDKCGAEL